MTLTKSEAGKLGALRSTQLAHEAKAKRIIEYDKDPAKCSACLVSLSYENRTKKFCSQSCSAKTSNSRRVRYATRYQCEVCGKASRNVRFCTTTCANNHKENLRDQKVIEGKASSGQVKSYLLKARGHKCEYCSNTHHISSVNDFKPVAIPLELEHKDGNSSNNVLENCVLICPTCHALTPTYKNKNKGNGRAARRQRYQDGKSY